MDQSLHVKLNDKRLAARQIDELVGIARGICADGNVNQQEVEFLQKWLAANLDIRSEPVIAPVYSCVQSIMADGVADEFERKQLMELLISLVRNDFDLGETLLATRLPLCDPPPSIQFDGRRFCFTGTFAMGTRSECEAVVQERSGSAGSLTHSTNYLVIGGYATDSWKHSSFGNKISKAVEMREKGVPISIVSEKHFRDAL